MMRSKLGESRLAMTTLSLACVLGLGLAGTATFAQGEAKKEDTATKTAATPAKPAEPAKKDEPAKKPEAAKPAEPAKPASQQDRMKDCNKQADGKKGDERKDFMKSCLKG